MERAIINELNLQVTNNQESVSTIRENQQDLKRKCERNRSEEPQAKIAKLSKSNIPISTVHDNTLSVDTSIFNTEIEVKEFFY